MYKRQNYHHKHIQASNEADALRIDAPGLHAVFKKTENPGLPPGSVFKDWREARMYAGPLPLTFDYEKQTNSIIVIEGVREHWEPRPAEVEASSDFFKDARFAGKEPILSSAFLIEEVPYSWKRGRREQIAAK